MAKIQSIQSAEDELLYAQGKTLASNGCYEKALTYVNLALASRSENYEAMLLQVVMLIQLKRYKEALVSCENLLEIQPNDKQAWVCRGVVLNYLGRYKQSYASYQQALELHLQ